MFLCVAGAGACVSEWSASKFFLFCPSSGEEGKVKVGHHVVSRAGFGQYGWPRGVLNAARIPLKLTPTDPGPRPIPFSFIRDLRGKSLWMGVWRDCPWLA